ncbi:glycosyltransferase family 2 protein, partial [Photobacterium kagoshimensis]|uniref:glycosyltransferase family 2 protein n=1 Tax=Photobacterium kagoshimensis TaxID=2910242 RepID=UPI003D0F6672
MCDHIALIIVLYNAEECIDDFVSSLNIQCFKKYTIFVVDNSDDDNAIKKLAALCLENKLKLNSFQMDENVGVAAANNFGIKKATEYGFSRYLVLNYDIEIKDPFFLDKIIKRASEGKKLITTPSYFYGTEDYWFGGGVFLRNKGNTQHLHFKESSDNVKLESNTEYAPTTMMYIDKDVIEKVGYFDEDYFVYFDDSDFIFRCNKMKYQVFMENETSYYHKVSQSTGNDSCFYTYYMSRNRLIFINKNYNGIKKIVPLLYTLLTYIY